MTKEHAQKIIAHAERTKSGAVKTYDEFVFWFAFFVAIFGNFFVSVAIVPLLLVTPMIYLYLAIPALGFGVRMAIWSFMKNVAHLKKARHNVIMFISAVIALANIYIVAHISNILAALMHLKSHNPQLIALLYTAGFLIPFLFKK